MDGKPDIVLAILILLPEPAMGETDATRRFDEKEFALILRKAAALQQNDAARPARAGLSLAEIESIAAEAGIDSTYVRRAVAATSSELPGVAQRLTGAPPRFQYERELAAPLDREGLAAVLDIARAEFGRHGATREVLDGIEWTGRDDYGAAWLAIHAHGGAPRVVVGADRTNAAWVLGLLLPLAGLVGAAIVGAVAGIDPGPILPTAGAVGGLLTARGLWRRTVARWQARVRRVLERSSATAAPAAPPD